MRRSGKYWWLIFSSSLLSLLATILLVFWHDGTGWFELWFDSECIAFMKRDITRAYRFCPVVPSGFGASSIITATLIVSLHLMSSFYEYMNDLNQFRLSLLAFHGTM